MKGRLFLASLAACAVAALAALPAVAADAVFPVASRIGLVPPAGLQASTSFPGFEDQSHSVFVRLVALPANAFGEIDKTMTNAALKKQGMMVEKREPLAVAGAKGVLIIARQEAGGQRIRKYLLIAPVQNVTALVSFEMPAQTPAPYSDTAIRAAMATLAVRESIPPDEQLQLVPFRVSETAGMRLVRVVPGVAAQFTDGPKDSLDAVDQPQLVIAATAGGPQQTGDRDQFARNAMGGIPPFKDFRIINSESMRIGGQPGHEIRAQGKDPQTGADIEIVQWLRFGTGAYLRIVGFAPKDGWNDVFNRFRAVRDGVEAR